ncbi:MAG: hypothetical protein QM753_11620 [Thermomicrobiales bacterium]
MASSTAISSARRKLVPQHVQCRLGLGAAGRRDIGGGLDKLCRLGQGSAGHEDECQQQDWEDADHGGRRTMHGWLMSIEVLPP